MSIVTCDVVEAGAVATSTTFAEIDSTVTTTSVARSFMIWAISAILTTGAVATDEAWLQPAADVVERVTATSSVITQANLTETLTDATAVASSALIYLPDEMAVSSAAVSDSVALERTTNVTERAAATDTALVNAAVVWTVTENATASSALFGFNDYVLTDTSATASSSVLMNAVHSALLVSGATATDSVFFDNDLSDLLVDTAYASSSTFAQVVATATLTDYAVATDRAFYALTALGWVMNTESFGMSRYTALPFASMAVVNGRVLALGEAGLYELAGDTDEGQPVHALISTGRSMLGTDSVKRVPEAHITGTADGELRLTVAVYGERKGSYGYAIPQRASDAPRGHRVKLGKGLSSVYWKFTLSNTDGADFVIDSMNADVAPSTTRRI